MSEHTDSVEALVKELRMVADMINMGEKIQWGRETTLMDRAADMLTTLQATHQQQVEAMSPDIREDFYKWFTARKGQKDIADWWLARTSQQVEEAETEVKDRAYKFVAEYKEKYAGCGMADSMLALDELLQALTPNHQD